MLEPSSQICPGCKLALAPQSGPAHPYIGASPSCWALFCDVLGREFSDPRLMRVHRLTVDAYAAQHPGTPGRRSTQSVWLHLAGLYLTMERTLSPDFARRVLAWLSKNSARLDWLPPPDDLGAITILHVATAANATGHEEAVRHWAATTWAAWKPHHGAVAAIADAAAARL